MRTHTDRAKKGNHVTNGGRHRLISDMYGQHHDGFLEAGREVESGQTRGVMGRGGARVGEAERGERMGCEELRK